MPKILFVRFARHSLRTMESDRYGMADMVTEGGEVHYSIDGDGLVDVLWLQTPLCKLNIMDGIISIF